MSYEDAVQNLLDKLEIVKDAGARLAPKLEKHPKGKPVSDSMMRDWDVAQARARGALQEVFRAAIDVGV